jgi:DNA-binding NtrC family response regulator
MKNLQTNDHQQRTILVIHNDAAVLVLLQGILAEHYRVLVAADADSAVRLAMLEDVPMDLTLIGRDTRGVRNTRELQRRLTSVRPNLRVMSMVGSVDEHCIKIKTVGIPKAHRAENLLEQVRWAMSVRRLSQTITSNVPADASYQERRHESRLSGATLIARAGTATQ